MVYNRLLIKKKDIIIITSLDATPFRQEAIQAGGGGKRLMEGGVMGGPLLFTQIYIYIKLCS